MVMAFIASGDTVKPLPCLPTGCQRKEAAMNKLMYGIGLLALTTSFLSCGLKRNLNLITQQQKEIVKSLKQEKIVIESNAERQFSQTDSNSTHYSLLIKPKGNFTYNEKTGFNGSAEYVSLNGYTSHYAKRHQQEKSASKIKQEKSLQQVQKQVLRAKHKQVESKKTWPIYLHLIWLLPIVALFYRYRAKFRLLFFKRKTTTALGKKNYRSAITGRFIKKDTALLHPQTSVGEKR